MRTLMSKDRLVEIGDIINYSDRHTQGLIDPLEETYAEILHLRERYSELKKRYNRLKDKYALIID